jgi:chromosome segregation ATPase
MIANDKAELLKKFREVVKQAEVDFEAKKPTTEELLRKSKAKQDRLIELINDRVRQLESEKTELEREIQGLREQADTATRKKAEAEDKTEAALKDKAEAENKMERLVTEKAEAEKKLAEVKGNAEGLGEQITGLKGDLNKAVSIAESAVREKGQMQEKLVQFQENWEKYVASR